MPLLYNAVKRLYPKTKKKKWYDSPKLNGKHLPMNFGKGVAKVSSLSLEDILKVIIKQIDKISKGLTEGDGVKFNGFGVFAFHFTALTELPKKEVTINNIKDIYVLFNPMKRPSYMH